MKVFLVDDTRLARQELKTLLAGHEVTIAGEAADIPEARREIERLHPDLLLLDIQLPSGTGFDLLEGLDFLPLVIFTTAYDHHAVQAFEANALDYLVKPIDPARLAQALARARQAQAVDNGGGTQRPLRADELVFVRDGERCWFVRLGEIERIDVDGNYAHVHFRGERALLARSLSALEGRLDPATFFRANRGTLINLQFVRNIEPWVNDGYRIELRDGSEIEVSRRQARELRERLAL